MVSNVARYVEVVNKLKERVSVHFCDQATVAMRTTKEINTPVFDKTELHVRMYLSGIRREEGSLNRAKTKDNPVKKVDNKPKLEDWEHKLADNKYLEAYITHKERKKVWAENKSK